MIRAKISLLVEHEYTLDPEWYPKGLSPEEMLAVDVERMQQDPDELLSFADTTCKVSGQLLETSTTKEN